MNIFNISFPVNDNNINVVRKLAREKDYTLKAHGYEDTFDLIDKQDGKRQFHKAPLEEIYEFLRSLDA